MSSKADKAAALARLVAARRSGTKTVDVADFKVDSMYEEVTEEVYRSKIAEHRKNKSFVTGKGEECV